MRAKKTFFLTITLFILALVMRGPAMADGINGFVEFNYNTLDTRASDATGLSTESKQTSILERYNLNLERTIYPYLKLRAGGLFEKTVTNIVADDTDTRSSDTKIIPSIDLTLSNPFIMAGAGYNKREEKQETRGLSSTTMIRDTYNTLFGLRPEGLPTLDTVFMRTDTYDKARLFRNEETDYFSLSSRFLPVKDLDLRYQFTSNDAKDRLTDEDVKVLTQTGLAKYSSQFFNNRISVYSSYNISRQETDVTSGVAGEVPFQLFPFSGLSAINDTPSMGALNPNPALIDGDLTASSGINIGQPSIPGNDTKFRNMGLDFVNSTEVNTLYVKVDPTIDMPAVVASSFVWDVYTSPDNLSWNHVQTITAAPFDSFEHRFEIDFTNVTTRFIKVVTQPLGVGVPVPPNFDRSNINVTELQAFIRKSVTTETIKTTVQIYELSTRARLLDNPYLYYDFYYWHTKTDPTGLTRYILSNGLSLSQRISKVFTGTARIAREDGEETVGKRVSYVYSASLMAIPLPTLSHSLVVSGRNESIDGKPFDTNSVFLNNSAALYRGVDVNLSGGVSSATSVTKQKTDSTLLNFGVSLVPYRTMTINLSYSGTATKQSGGDTAATSTYSRRGDASVAFNPWSTVYLFASIGIDSESNKQTNTVQNYAATWSPFPGGALQFNFSYSENLRSEDNEKDTFITPSIRWNIIPRTFFDIAYQIVRRESLSQDSRSKNLNMNLKMYF